MTTKGCIELSEASGYGLKDSELNDFIFYNTATHQNMLFGYKDNNAVIKIVPESVSIRKPLIIQNSQILVDNANTSLNNPSYSWTNNDNTGIYLNSQNNIGMCVGNTEMLVISDSNINITKDANVEGDLYVKNSVFLEDSISISNNMTISNQLNVLGNSSFSNSVTIDSDLNVIQNIQVNGSITLSDSYTITTQDDLIPSEISQANSRIGIGETNPSYKLHVVGDIYSTQDIKAASDERLKEDIQPIDNVMKRMTGVRGRKFKRVDTAKDSRDNYHLGFIAQQIKDFVPECVGYNEERDLYNVSYGNITALLAEAFHSVYDKVIGIEKRVDSLCDLLNASIVKS